MATQELMAILLRKGDTMLWLPSGDGDGLTPIELLVKDIHYSTPIAGKIEVVVEGHAPLRLSSRSPVSVVVKLKNRQKEPNHGKHPDPGPRHASRGAV